MAAAVPLTGIIPKKDAELRKRTAKFSREDPPEWHAKHIGAYQDAFNEWNEKYFDGEMIIPEYFLDSPSSPRIDVEFQPTGGQGLRGLVYLRPSMITGDDKKLRKGDEAAEGRHRYCVDLIRRAFARQRSVEILAKPETGWHGYGPVCQRRASS